MTDLDMVKVIALAIGLTPDQPSSIATQAHWYCRDEHGNHVIFDPLHDDAQAMALVKRFRLHVMATTNDKGEPDWFIVRGKIETAAFDLNRAIVECVAKLPALGDTRPAHGGKDE